MFMMKTSEDGFLIQQKKRNISPMRLIENINSSRTINHYNNEN